MKKDINSTSSFSCIYRIILADKDVQFHIMHFEKKKEYQSIYKIVTFQNGFIIITDYKNIKTYILDYQHLYMQIYHHTIDPLFDSLALTRGQQKSKGRSEKLRKICSLLHMHAFKGTRQNSLVLPEAFSYFR